MTDATDRAEMTEDDLMTMAVAFGEHQSDLEDAMKKLSDHYTTTADPAHRYAAFNALETAILVLKHPLWVAGVERRPPGV